MGKGAQMKKPEFFPLCDFFVKVTKVSPPPPIFAAIT